MGQVPNAGALLHTKRSETSLDIKLSTLSKAKTEAAITMKIINSY